MFKLSVTASADIDEIFDYSIEQFGAETAIDYHQSLHDCFSHLAENPKMGRNADNLRAGYRRFEHRSHIVFYINEDDGITIVRVIHKSRNVPELFA